MEDVLSEESAAAFKNTSIYCENKLFKHYFAFEESLDDLIDFDLGVKITGAGFPVYKGKGAKLQRALINFFLDEASKAGYQEYMPPLMVNETSMGDVTAAQVSLALGNMSAAERVKFFEADMSTKLQTLDAQMKLLDGDSAAESN